MKVYVASSWQSLWHPTVVKAIREAGHSCYDYREQGDYWDRIQLPQPWRNRLEENKLVMLPEHVKKVLAKEEIVAGFRQDMEALREAEAAVLVLPAGASSHMEMGMAVAAGKATAILLRDPWAVGGRGTRLELTYEAVDLVATEIRAVIGWLGKLSLDPDPAPDIWYVYDGHYLGSSVLHYYNRELISHLGVYLVADCGQRLLAMTAVKTKAAGEDIKMCEKCRSGRRARQQ